MRHQGQTRTDTLGMRISHGLPVLNPVQGSQDEPK